MHEYEKKASPYVNVYTKFGTISNVPKIVLELVTALLIIGYLFYVFFIGIPLESVIQNLIIFAFVGLRTIPSLNKLFGAIAQIKYFGTQSENFHKMFSETTNKFKYTSEITTFDNVLEFKNIYYKYPNKEELVLRNVNFIIEKNKRYGFVGKSGSGKSTLFNVVLGLNSPLKGEILVDNKSYSSLENIDLTKLISMVSQSIFILDGSFERNILFFNKCCDNSLLDEAIVGSQLRELIGGNKEHIVGEDGNNLSGGQKQRLAIARTLYANKNILLLDEATSALDNETEKNFIQYLQNKKNHTILVIAHRLTTVKNCDKIFVFKDGEIVDSGSFQELSDNSKEFNYLLNSGEFSQR